MDLNHSEQDIRELLDEFFQTGYSLKDFCNVADQDEATMRAWIKQYHPDRQIPEENLFIEANIVKDERKAGRPKNRQQAEPVLFARVGDIELYREVSSTYLKSLKS